MAIAGLITLSRPHAHFVPNLHSPAGGEFESDVVLLKFQGSLNLEVANIELQDAAVVMLGVRLAAQTRAFVEEANILIWLWRIAHDQGTWMNVARLLMAAQGTSTEGMRKEVLQNEVE